jgi:DnaJ like chaperone protein
VVANVSVWGKIIGGVAGFAVGGPIGALVGGVAGHVFDRQRARAAEDGGDGTKQIAFTIGVIALGAKMAKADGVVTADEVQAFKEVFHVPPEEMKNVSRIFDLARRDARGYEPYARHIAKLFEDRREVLEELLDGLFHIAKADNDVPDDEIRFLSGVARIFGFSDAEFGRIREGHLGPNDADPYRILDVDRAADNEAIKTAYRRLIREHHPDRLIAAGMPAEFIEVANRKLAAINGAYDRVARERGIK